MQFTTEAVTLCSLGGILGILVGAIITWIVYFLPIGLPATLSSTWVLTGFGASCALGCCLAFIPHGKLRTLTRLRR
ncbi:MAG: hypothetical protein WDM87_18080 [Terracidiphilus sp.]